MYRAIAGGIIATVLALVFVANASAAQEEIELNCGADGTMTVQVNGNGQFSPGRIEGGGVIIPVAFSNQHGSFTDNEGHTEEFNDPDVTKGNGHPGKNKDLVTCDFSISFEDENGSGTFSGTVTAIVVGR
jgi:hypothetical protein